MDADRFDTLSRSLTDLRSRRTALASLLGGALGLVGLAEADAKKKCPPCKKRKHDKCKKKLPDGIGCPGGTCQNGSCIAAAAAAAGDGCTPARICGNGCCPDGQTCCSELCTDTISDPRHCGNCATACEAGKICAGGRCCTARQGLACTATS
jgi:hypothetical protein